MKLEFSEVNYGPLVKRLTKRVMKLVNDQRLLNRRRLLRQAATSQLYVPDNLL
jgi:hypothetical protein